MTKETAIEMLDYSKPPPGIDPRAMLLAHRGGTWGPREIAAAWAEHDPPGMTVTVDVATGDDVYWFAPEPPPGHFATCFPGEPVDNEAEARAAAWAWHNRRHALARDIADQIGKSDGAAELLAAFLRWTDDECAEVEAYAALPFPRSVDMPAALRRVLLPEPAR